MNLTQKQKQNLKGFLGNVIRHENVEIAYEQLLSNHSYIEDNVLLDIIIENEYANIFNIMPEQLKESVRKNKDELDHDVTILNIYRKGEGNFPIMLDTLEDYSIYLETKMNVLLGGNHMYNLNTEELKNLALLLESSDNKERIIERLLSKGKAFVTDEESPLGLFIRIFNFNEKNVYSLTLNEILSDEEKQKFESIDFESYIVIEYTNLETGVIKSLRLNDLKCCETLLIDFILTHFPNVLEGLTEEVEVHNSEGDEQIMTKEILTEKTLNEKSFILDGENIDPGFSVMPDEDFVDPDFSVDPEDEDIDLGFDAVQEDEDGEYGPIILTRGQMDFIIKYLTNTGFDIFQVKEFMEGTVLQSHGIQYKIRILDEYKAAINLNSDLGYLIERYPSMFEKRPYIMVKPISTSSYVYNVIPHNYEGNSSVLQKNFNDVFNEKMILIKKEEERRVEESLFNTYCIQPRQ